MENGALSDLRVIEWGHVVSAPYCARMLADLGAEVTKIEEPNIGDEARRLGPFPNNMSHPERSGLFLALNFNKLGITLNPRTPKGVRLFKELVRDADILVENNPPGLMETLGIGYEALSKVNPKLIMTSITPFGQTGPWSHYKAYELTTWHAGGWGYLFREGGAGEKPGLHMKMWGRQSGFQAAYNGAIATMCAVYSREKTGVGQHVDISEQESWASIMTAYYFAYQILNRIVGKDPRNGWATPSGELPCKDGSVAITAPLDNHWKGLFEVMGNPDWSKADFARSPETRLENFELINKLVKQWTETRPRDEIVQECGAKRVPVCPLNRTMKEIIEDAHLAARGYFVEIEHPEVGKLKYPSVPYKLFETPAKFDRPAPCLGQHNEEVYCGRLGRTKQDLKIMKKTDVI